MVLTKTVKSVLPVLLLVALGGHAQVITSKKEAVKKGVYKKPSNENVSTDVKNTVVALSESEDRSPKTGASAKVKQQNSKTPVASKAKTTAKPTQKTKNLLSLINDKEDPDLLPAPDENYIAVQMINNAMSFIGTRYLGGGTTTNGMDCSGMVTAVYNLFGMKIPRSSRDMAKVGKKVEGDEIKKGDLVFFHTNGKRAINHVGMVVEVNGDEIKFVHSSTHEGVIVSSTKEPYYEKAFVQANRML